MASVYLEKGKIMRLANREAVEKGLYYVTATCKGCKQPINITPWHGLAREIPLIGPGRVSVPCRICGTDEIYNTDDFSVRLAVTARPAVYQRAKPSGMPRQPILYTKYRDAKFTFGPHALEDRPKAAILVARIIGTSSEIDATIALLLGRMMKADTPAAMALFLSLRQSRVQYEALNAVARVTLNESDFLLFSALMSLRRSSDNERDALAHGRIGEAAALPDGIVWVDSYDFLQFSLKTEAGEEVLKAQDWLRERMFVYELGDLETIAQNAEKLYNSIKSFNGYLLSDDIVWRAERHPQLCEEPHVKQAIYQLREGTKRKAEPRQ